MKNPKILLVEDDNNLGQILKEYLEVKGYKTTLCRDGESGLKTFKKLTPNRENFDLCIFDVMMPKLDGLSLAEQVREIDPKIPIIFLTAKALKEDAIEGFKAGADDYIGKPFNMEELLLRIKAILKRTMGNEEQKIETKFKISNCQFDANTQILLVNGKSQRLTSKEAALLHLLCLKKNNTLERSQALKKIWFEDNYFNSRSMDVYITKLRKYLKPDSNLQIINIHGQGFKLIELKP